MKSIFRFLAVGALITGGFAAAGYAQDACANIEAKQATYKIFTDNYSGTTQTQRRAALSASKEYVEKYGSCTDDKPQVDYFNAYIPKAEKIIKDIDDNVAKQARYARFNTAQTGKNWDEFYAAGKEIIANEPADSDIPFDIMIAFGTVGVDQSAAGNTKYNADTIKYAQMAIDKINSGKTSKNYGVPGKSADVNFAYGTKDKSLGWLNYNIAYLKYYVDKSDAAKKEAIPYFYKVTQSNAPTKNYANVYYAIGSTYYAELTRLETDRQAKIKAAENKDTDETKQIYAMEKGYADRVLDAFSRVYNLQKASTDPKDKTAKDATYKDLKDVYTFRYDGKSTTPLDTLIAGTATKPLIDPSTPVMPIVEVAPTPATTGTTGMTAAPTGATSTAPTTPVKPATPATTTKPAAATKPATTAKTPAKKTSPKK